MYAGALASIAGIVLTARISSGQPGLGLGFELDAIASSVIGGTSLTGGVGSVFGTIAGALVIGIINNGILVDDFTNEELEVRCKRCIKLKVDDTKKAATILETVIGTTNYDILPDHTIRLFDHLDNTAYVNSELSKNDIMIESSSLMGQDLEGYFMELMEGNENV